MASAHAPRRRRHKAGSAGVGGGRASGLAERWVSRRKLPKARGGADAGGWWGWGISAGGANPGLSLGPSGGGAECGARAG